MPETTDTPTATADPASTTTPAAPEDVKGYAEGVANYFDPVVRPPNYSADAMKTLLATGEAIADVEHRVTILAGQDEGPDGSGQEVHVPVAILPGPNGALVHKLLDAEYVRLCQIARAQRLAVAKGPDYREGTTRVGDLASFIRYVNVFKSETAVLFADVDARTITAELDYHEKGADGAARWRQRTVVYAAPLTDQWLFWTGWVDKSLEPRPYSAGQYKPSTIGVSQGTLARLLEERQRELAVAPEGAPPGPNPAQLLAMANTLEVFRTTRCKRERDPVTGRTSLSFQTEAGTRGDAPDKTPIYPRFYVKCPVFRGEAAGTYEVALRFEVNEQGSGAQFEFGVQSARDVIEDAFQVLVAKAEAETGCLLFVGTAEPAEKRPTI